MAAPASALRQQAIEWLVEARSGSMNARQHQALADWRQSSPAHEAAWAQVCGALDQVLQPLAPHTANDSGVHAAMGALLQPDRRRRQLVRGTLAFAGLGLTGLFAHRATPLPGLLADAHTATAERRSLHLADGSHLLLDARSAVDIALDSQHRRIHLRQGALIATVAADATRPFIVQTPHGEIRPASGSAARCMVRLRDQRTQVAALAHDWSLQTPQGRSARLLAGHSAWLESTGNIATDTAPAEDLAAWQHGMLAVRGGTLDEVVAALRPYRRGFIRLSPEAARLRVLGAFPLDDTEHTLQALADTLPINVTRYQGGWMTVIDRA